MDDSWSPRTLRIVALIALLALGYPLFATSLRSPEDTSPRGSTPNAVGASLVASLPTETAAAERTETEAAPPSTSAPAQPVRRAVIVGLDNAPGTPRLYGATRDAETLRDALVRYGYAPDEISLLTDGEATRARILDAMRELADVPANGQAIFAFAGHARWSKGRLRVTTADGQPIWESDFAAALSGVTAPLWVNFATCYAAGFDMSGIVGPKRVVTFAAPANRYAWESKKFGRSFLVQYMIHDGMLEGLAADASVEDAFAYADERLRAEYPAHVGLIDDRFNGEFRLAPRAAQAPQLDEADVPLPGEASVQAPPAEPRPERSEAKPAPKRNGSSHKSPAQICSGVVRYGNCKD